VSSASPASPPITRQSAVRFIVALGLISLLADVTYEGARSITGPYLGTLGASAAVVGIVAGLGELVGYTLRLLFGYAADRTRAYWALTITGYVVNLLAVPFLALAHRWEIAAVLIIAERAGKAVRTPARDVMLSQASKLTGRGWGFGLHEAMDQVGAFLGPLVVAVTLAQSRQYTHGFAVLAIPAGLAIATLLTARSFYPDPTRFETEHAAAISTTGFPRTFWIYVAAAGLIAAGIADFALVSFHFQQAHVTSAAMTPVFYSVAMGVEALAALVFGRLFDKRGIAVVVLGVVLLALSTPLVFLGSFYVALAGMAIWGAGQGAQQSALRAGIAELVPPERRGSAYGIFNTVYGLLWFTGSATMGLLYGRSIIALVGFGMVCQLIAIPLLWSVRKRPR
jgi:MFS family permease